MPLNLKAVDPATVAAPSSGYSSLFPDANGNWGSKDSTGKFVKLVDARRPIVNDFNRIRRILPFGDSITQNNASFTAGVRMQGAGYAENAIRKAGRFTTVGNAGISGNTVAQMRARLATDVIALKPDAVLFMAGTNSVIDGITFPQMAAVLNDYEYIIQQLLVNGIIPILVTPPAKGTPNTGFAETRDFIPFLYDLASFYGLPLIDVFKFTVNPVTGGYRTGLSDDQVHPAAGINVIGDYVAWHLQHLDKCTNQVYLSGLADVAAGSLHNVLQNGTFSNAATANQPDFWGPNANAGATLSNATVLVPSGGESPLARSNGNLFSYTVTANPGRYALYSPVANAAWKVGDVLEFSGRVTASGLTYATAQGFTVAVDMDGSGAHMNVVNTDRSAPQDGIFSVEFAVPSGTTALNVTAYTQDLGVYTYNNFTLTNKTTRQGIWSPGSLQV